jgi:hypothetical protein
LTKLNSIADGDGATPLHFAASRGHLSVVRWLLNHGAKLSLDKYGKSPINDAAENQQTECLNVLVQHSSDFMSSNNKQRNPSSKQEKFNLSHGSFISKGSTASSDSEPFYLHPPTNGRPLKDGLYTRTSPDGGYYGGLPNDGIFINPMRSTFGTPPSPSDSGESFFLHDPQEVIYNRVKDVFESDTSLKEEPINRNNAMTVQAEIHSSSSGAASGSDDDVQNDNTKNVKKPFVVELKAPSVAASTNHDYEDIYLVREEAKTSSKKFYGRSRSRDSGSHSRSASTSSTRSQNVVVQTKSTVSLSYKHLKPNINPRYIFPQIHFDTSSRYEIPRKNSENSTGAQNMQSSSMNAESTYESVGPSEIVYERKINNNMKSSLPIDGN